ncbi:MAG: NAD(P)-binding protein, partial [Candidatus Deferrimicrobiaceae bacterium]
MDRKTCVIAGAGPAGLTAALELLEKTDVLPIVYEMTESIGGISRTVNYGGNRIDLGGHRFFSKSDRVMAWWQEILPLQGAPAKDDILLERKIPLSTLPGAPDPEKTDRAMLIRSRLSRILYLRKFFDYPISLNATTIRNLGFARIGRIGLSYARARIFPIRGEKSLEDFFINRFGRELYRTFFEDYTEKVWGVP